MVAPERRACRRQRSEGLVKVAARRPYPGPVQLGQVIEDGAAAAQHPQDMFGQIGGGGQVASFQGEQGAVRSAEKAK